ncbi:sugar transferase [Geodermatophilus sabuli]|uniref:Exopolysaccharide biosynthesis polyprenyl glycosylphosphotransferase n=1 Tax=Geodermatophilus sabuli TaxID=1564158 RepID=A0A285EF54_9ACTN|nr:sugar transferase [Geodermatophilus sabuli]MBB3083598.1 exopolysaccharide biosynthesis polyprenyl glycosylphosphotransferase [Geodermatophilus sabuli]SNX96681.1 exopolysaccharide biosynthesis polyprenyl glycosylphosphotransferase [Geodermatophilus sabuli]
MTGTEVLRRATTRWQRSAPVSPIRLRGEGTVARRAWRRTYVRRIMLADVACALVAAAAGYLVRFGPDHTTAAAASKWIALLLPAVWLLAMLISRSYEERFLWNGPEEFRRVFFAAALLLAGVATVAWGLRLDVARGFVVIALPLAAGLTLVQRYAQRKRLHHLRRQGRFLQTTLLVGHVGGVAALHDQMIREAYQGYRVIGCCLPSPRPGQDFDGIPVLGALDEVVAVVERYEVDTVAVLPSPELDGAALRRLGWDLENTRAELLLAPAVSEIVGPRVRIRPVCGLPLMHMERPELRGIRRLTKDVFDRAGAALALLTLSPLLLGLALAVKLSSTGPVLFTQERVGRAGRPFRMLKFRSMQVGADGMVDRMAERNDGNGVLFKQKDDPRVTRVGRVMRRHSLDELPQLFNVLRGEMSLVGPRPPLPSEVALYGLDMRRRFLVKPGLTGLWQVSGRSDLSWDDSVRIDLRYVENWSLTFDLMILCKTLRAVVRGSGAY